MLTALEIVDSSALIYASFSNLAKIAFCWFSSSGLTVFGSAPSGTFKYIGSFNISISDGNFFLSFLVVPNKDTLAGSLSGSNKLSPPEA